MSLGWKEFQDGVVLPASDINGYLQQGVLVFDDAATRTTALAGNLVEGMYSYLRSDKLTYLYNGALWIRVGQPDLDTQKNFQAFPSTGSTTIPDWATKMYYVIVRGGNNGIAGSGNGGAGGAGGQMLQGNVAVTGGVSVTVTVGGAGSSSSVAIAGGSTFTATGTQGAGGATATGNFPNDGGAGVVPSAPFNFAHYGGGGGSGAWTTPQIGGFSGGNGGIGGGGQGGGGFKAAQTGRANQGGGGGGGDGQGDPGAVGGSGVVLLYFS